MKLFVDIVVIVVADVDDIAIIDVSAIAAAVDIVVTSIILSR